MEQMRGEDFHLLGDGLVRQNQALAAIQVMERGLRDDPRHPELLEGLSRLYAQQDDLSKAADLAGRLAEVPGWEARGDLLVAVLRAEQSDPADTAERLERALARDPALRGAAATPAKARKLLARARLRLGQPAPAREALEAVLAGGEDPEAAWLLSRALLQLGDPRRGLRGAGAFARLRGGVRLRPGARPVRRRGEVRRMPQSDPQLPAEQPPRADLLPDLGARHHFSARPAGRRLTRPGCGPYARA
jgi:tetratricopeptide (TPR) repeat protein